MMDERTKLSGEDSFGLKPLWEALYSIYEVFASICDKHGLRYYALGGTLLGAVRHNGFIPWDDDMDVAMPRPDYEKFISVSIKELPEHIKFVNWKNTPEFKGLYGKFQDVREDEIRRIEKETGRMLSNGLFLDIFPIDGYPMGLRMVWVKIRHSVVKSLELYYSRKFIELTLKAKAAWLLGFLLSCFTGQKNEQDGRAICYKFYENELKRNAFEESEYIGDVGIRTNVFFHPPQRKASLGTPKDYPFFNKSIKLPEDPADMLEARYGKTYMTLPPISERHPSHALDRRMPWWLGPTLG